MSEDKIEKGDSVIVNWGKDYGTMKGIVVNTPSATGDTWCIKDEKGNLHHINPYYIQFHSITKFNPLVD